LGGTADNRHLKKIQPLEDPNATLSTVNPSRDVVALFRIVMTYGAFGLAYDVARAHATSVVGQRDGTPLVVLATAEH